MLARWSQKRFPQASQSISELFPAYCEVFWQVLMVGSLIEWWSTITPDDQWLPSMINDHWSEWWSMTDGQKSNKSKTRPPKLIKTLRSKLEIAQKYSGRLAGTFFDSIEPAFYVDYNVDIMTNRCTNLNQRAGFPLFPGWISDHPTPKTFKNFATSLGNMSEELRNVIEMVWNMFLRFNGLRSSSTILD